MALVSAQMFMFTISKIATRYPPLVKDSKVVDSSQLFRGTKNNEVASKTPSVLTYFYLENAILVGS